MTFHVENNILLAVFLMRCQHLLLSALFLPPASALKSRSESRTGRKSQKKVSRSTCTRLESVCCTFVFFNWKILVETGAFKYVLFRQGKVVKSVCTKIKLDHHTITVINHGLLEFIYQNCF